MERTVAGAFLLGAIGMGLYSLSTITSPWFVLIGGAMTGAGLSTVLTLGTDLVVTAAPKDRVGAASALSETGIELGASLGIAVLGSLGAYVYTMKMQAAPLMDFVSPATAATVETTLGNALTAIADYPVHVQDAVLAHAKPAFVSGMATATFVGACITLVLAWLVPLLLRRSVAHQGVEA